jgi:nitroreductase
MRTRPYCPYVPPDAPEVCARRFYDVMRQRRSVRFFSDAPVSEETLRACIAAAGTAPSGANKQPWRFVCVRDANVKRAIRIAAEAEERAFYTERASEVWLRDLEPLGTDAEKPFLEVAPWLVVMFKLVRGDPDAEGHHGKVYYPDESVGIAAGMFLAALHHAGLVTLTHTPSPMAFLSRVLKRPSHERPYLLLPVGYPAAECTVPDIARKPLDEIMVVV